MIKIIIKFVVLLKIFLHLLPAFYGRLSNIISFLESAWQSLANKEKPKQVIYLEFSPRNI